MFLSSQLALSRGMCLFDGEIQNRIDCSQLALSRGMCRDCALRCNRAARLPTCTLARDVSFPAWIRAPDCYSQLALSRGMCLVGVAVLLWVLAPNLHSRAGCVLCGLSAGSHLHTPNLHSRAGCVRRLPMRGGSCRSPNLHSRAGCVSTSSRHRPPIFLPTCTLARDVSANITKMQAVCMEYIYIIYTLPSALTSYGAKRASESVTLLDFWVWSHPCRRCEGRVNTLFTSPSHAAFH